MTDPIQVVDVFVSTATASINVIDAGPQIIAVDVSDGISGPTGPAGQRPYRAPGKRGAYWITRQPGWLWWLWAAGRGLSSTGSISERDHRQLLRPKLAAPVAVPPAASMWRPYPDHHHGLHSQPAPGVELAVSSACRPARSAGSASSAGPLTLRSAGRCGCSAGRVGHHRHHERRDGRRLARSSLPGRWPPATTSSAWTVVTNVVAQLAAARLHASGCSAPAQSRG